MGSMIYLSVGRLEVDWGKNHGFRDHSRLFQVRDVTPVPYWFISEDDSPFSELKDGLSKPLKQVVKRVKLLGYSENYARQEYNCLRELHDFNEQQFSFDDLANLLKTIDVESLDPDYGDGGEDLGKFFRRELAPRLGVNLDANWNLSDGMENLSAETILLLLSRNPRAENLAVTWQFADLEAGGWEPREFFVKPLPVEDRVLLVTEGSSDSHIIRHGLEILHPEIADFFYFADVKEGYPFSGEGNLANFARGLASIDVTNNIIFVFDNDAAGIAGRNKIASLGARNNMRVVTLPDLEVFKSFKTIGPMGERLADINGCAAAIECYLDLGADPTVRWTSYNSSVDRYQGELINKTSYAREFIKSPKLPPDYDISKLSALLDMLIATYAAMRENAQLASLNAYMQRDI